ncbi:MAG: adenylate kinase [Microcoleaceae cyanobacterium]
MTQIIFLGPPGAGKGTQAARIAEQENIPHISTGNILRSHVAEATDLGIQAKSYMDRGDLVPDQLILDMVRQRLAEDDAQTGWILDGFPRNIAQADFVQGLLQQQITVVGATLPGNDLLVINLEVPDEILVQRLLARGRQDDNEETIRRRLQVYREQTAPLIQFYQDQKQLVSVDGDASMDVVTDKLLDVIASTKVP